MSKEMEREYGREAFLYRVNKRAHKDFTFPFRKQKIEFTNRCIDEIVAKTVELSFKSINKMGIKKYKALLFKLVKTNTLHNLFVVRPVINWIVSKFIWPGMNEYS